MLDAVPILLHPLAAALNLALDPTAMTAAQAFGLAAFGTIRVLAARSATVGLAQATRLRRLLAVFKRARRAAAVGYTLAIRLCALVAMWVRATLPATMGSAPST